MALSSADQPAPESECGDHEARVSEDLLGLEQTLALHPADQRVAVDGYVVEVESSRVAQADAVLVLRFGLCEAVRASLDHEPARPAWRLGQDGVHVGDAAVADPLLATVEPVADDVPVLLDWSGGRLEGGEVAAGFGLGGAVGEQDPLVGDPGQPLLLLLRRSRPPRSDRCRGTWRARSSPPPRRSPPSPRRLGTRRTCRRPSRRTPRG